MEQKIPKNLRARRRTISQEIIDVRMIDTDRSWLSF
jgi:hypothetical protein